ncbi:MAG: molybdopterin-dependent oxidoreductase [Candidatus Kapabacteria bacterium]|nr:molybdopterin-dependent oxidoreductase [Ignavibacteriota bacterium]MCW5886124.1 molybdopterin-dependent oxidoreductase [Candidatus Kapabacteria bacterium]
MKQLSRRRFLKISAGTFAAAAVATTLHKGFYSEAESASGRHGESKIEAVPTYCEICFWKCGAIAYKKNGKLWKIEGNPDDPLSNGRLCTRGTGGVGFHNDPDRLKAPLIRKRNTKRGEDEWVVSTWDEAFNYIAEKMQKIKAEHGAKSTALFHHGTGGAFFKHLLNSYGCFNDAQPSFAQCRGPRDTGFMLTYGHVPGSPERVDVRNTKCLVLPGVHIGENVHNTLLQDFAHFIENNGSLIVVDPRYSIAASKAKYYLPIKPGTDIALFLAWMNVIVNENIYNKQFIEKYGSGFEEFKSEIKNYTPEWAYPITGINPEMTRDTAREMARYAPQAVIHPGRHTTKYGDDTQRSRAIALLNALLGNWNQKGGFYEPARFDLPKYPIPAYPEMHEKVDNPNDKYPFAMESITNGIIDATISGEPYPIKAWFVYSTNLLQAIPDRKRTIEAINNLDLMVAIDILPSEITGYADVVLPESVYLERFDELYTPPFKEPIMLYRQPVVEAPQDQKPGWWIAKKLGHKLNLDEYFPWNDIEDYLKVRVESAGVDYNELKKTGIAKSPKEPVYEQDGAPMSFDTPSGKVEFYSQQLLAAGYDPVPKYKPTEEPPAGFYRLIFGRVPMHTFSRTQTNRILSDLKDENEIWINADIARRWNIKNDQYIRLKNQDDILSNKIKAKVTEMIRTDCVYMAHGFGHTSKHLTGAYMKGANDTELLTNVKIDPLMGGTAMNLNFVTFVTEV